MSEAHDLRTSAHFRPILNGGMPSPGTTSEPDNYLLLRIRISADNDAQLMRYCTIDNLAEIQAQISDVIRDHLGNNAITRTQFYKGSLIILLSITGIVLISALSPGRLKLILRDIENIITKNFSRIRSHNFIC